MSGLEGLLEGKVLVNRYRIEHVIGRGGFAAVYSAADERLGRTVAVKVITLAAPDPALHEHLRERFQREARSAAGLPQHPNVVTVYDFGTDPKTGIDFLVMELLRGEDLASRLSREPRLPMELALRILREAVEGIAVGHRAGLVHRDVKPGNVFLAEPLTDEPFRVCVLDFGIAVVVAEQGTAQRLTQQGSAPLSPAYASPEQLGGEQDLTCASDVFSLGVLAYQLLTGERPFAAERRRGAGGWDVLPLRERNPAVPQAVADVVHRALAYAPGDRYEHAGAMGAALDAASGASPRSVAAATDDDDRTIVAPAAVIAGAAGAAAARAASPPIDGGGADDGDRTLLSSQRPTPVPRPASEPPRSVPAAAAAPVEPVPTRVAPAKKSRALPIAMFAALVLAGGAGAAVMLGRGGGDDGKDTKAASDTATAAPTTASDPGSAPVVSTGSEVPMSTGGVGQPSAGGAVTQPSAPDNGGQPSSDPGQSRPAPSDPSPANPGASPAPVPVSPQPQPSVPAPTPTSPRPAPAQPAPTRPAPPVSQPVPQPQPPQPVPPPAPTPQPEPPPDTAHMNPVPLPAPRDTLKLKPVAPPTTITIPPPADTAHRT